MNKLVLAVTGVCALCSATAFATPVNGTGNVTPDVIFGTGNANGSFTGVNMNNVELGLRGKLRYNLAGLPENTFNYDGDRTYTFLAADSNAPANRSAFNFEWSINVDPADSVGRFMADLTYLLSIDFDPSAAIGNVVAADPITVFFADHAFGNNSTGNGAGVNATSLPHYQSLISTSNVAQNSWNLGFFEPMGFDPQTFGTYTIGLQAFDGQMELASTSIDIVYGAPSVVPVPATLPLLVLGLVGLGAFARRQRKS